MKIYDCLYLPAALTNFSHATLLYCAVLCMSFNAFRITAKTSNYRYILKRDMVSYSGEIKSFKNVNYRFRIKMILYSYNIKIFRPP